MRSAFLRASRVVALPLDHVRSRVRCQMFVNERRIRLQPFLQIHHGVDRLYVDDNVANRVFRDVAALRHDHRDRLSDVPHFALRQRNLRAGVKHEIRYGRGWYQERPWPPEVSEIFGGIDRVDACARASRRRVDAFQPAMRVVTPDERHVQHPGQLDIVHEKRAARQQPRVFIPKNAGVKVAWFGWQA